MKQKLYTFLLALIASVSAIYAQSGICGDNLRWTLSNGTLTISGTGAMADYSSYSNATAPWYNYSSSIKSIVISDGVTSIGATAFYGCSKLTSVTIGNGVTSIGKYAFCYCSSLSSITIPNSVKSIGYGAFCYCSSLSSITIPNSVTSIGESAFCYCSSLTSITIPNSVTSIGDNAFAYCYSLTSVTIGNSVTSIGDNAFAYCYSLTFINVDAYNSKYSSADGVLFNKDKTTLIQYPIGNTRSEYIIPNSVISIEGNAFENCSSLTSVTIGNSVTSIGATAFYGCSKLTSVTIGNGVTSIGNYAFRGCSSLTYITIPNSVTSIGWNAFEGCSSLISPVYNAHCFAYMPTSYSGAYTIPEGIKQIAGGAFYECSSLSSITIPNSVTSIEAWAFRDCSSLTYITIPNSVTSIGDCAFYNCSSLTSVTIGNSVTSIGWNAFEGCSSLTSVHITDMAAWCEINYEDPTGNPLYYARNLYLNGEWVRSFVIPDSVTSIGNYAFYNCKNIKSVTIGNGVTSIGKYAFYNCDLTSVIIGNSVTSIGDYAFNCEDNYNSSLTSVVCWAEKPAIISYLTFDSRVRYIGLYVPCGCGDAYREATGWNIFNTFFEMEGYSIFTFVNDAKMGTTEVNNRTCKNAQIVATPKPGFRFVQWSDGVVNNPRSIVLTQDTTLIAEFAEVPSYVVEVIYNTDHGTVNGQGTYKENEVVTLTATANDGYKFHKWSDGVVNNPRSIVLTQDTVLIAEFTEIPSYVVEVIYNTDHGTVNGQGTYKEDEEVTLTATASDGYKFHKWSNGVTDNPYTFIVKSDVTLEAKFTSTEGIEDVLSSEVHTTKVIRDGQVLILRNGKTYTMQGQEVK